jgi:hypothetical protein
MMTGPGLLPDHTTIYRWVQRYAPEIDKRSRPHLKQTNAAPLKNVAGRPLRAQLIAHIRQIYRLTKRFCILREFSFLVVTQTMLTPLAIPGQRPVICVVHEKD